MGLPAMAQPEVRVWTTSLDLKSRLSEGPRLAFQTRSVPAGTGIQVNSEKTFQAILGLGSSLEHSTCSNLFRLAPSARRRALERLVSPTAGIGMNLMRICRN